MYKKQPKVHWVCATWTCHQQTVKQSNDRWNDQPCKMLKHTITSLQSGGYDELGWSAAKSLICVSVRFAFWAPSRQFWRSKASNGLTHGVTQFYIYTLRGVAHECADIVVHLPLYFSYSNKFLILFSYFQLFLFFFCVSFLFSAHLSSVYFIFIGKHCGAWRKIYSC